MYDPLFVGAAIASSAGATGAKKNGSETYYEYN